MMQPCPIDLHAISLVARCESLCDLDCAGRELPGRPKRAEVVLLLLGSSPARGGGGPLSAIGQGS